MCVILACLHSDDISVREREAIISEWHFDVMRDAHLLSLASCFARNSSSPKQNLSPLRVVQRHVEALSSVYNKDTLVHWNCSGMTSGGRSFSFLSPLVAPSVILLFRPRRSWSAAACSRQTFPWTICRSVGPSVGLSVGLSSALWKNGGSDPHAVWHRRSDGSRDEACRWWGLAIGPREGVLLRTNLGRTIVFNGNFMAYVCHSAATRPSV